MTIPPPIAASVLAEHEPIEHAARAVAAAHHAALRQFRAKYRRRRLVHRIDAALDLVERANIAGDPEPPAAAVALIEELGGPTPSSALKAHAELFRLQRRCLRTVVYEGETADREDDDQVAGVALTVLGGTAG